jgi:hypothetical protein
MAREPLSKSCLSFVKLPLAAAVPDDFGGSSPLRLPRRAAPAMVKIRCLYSSRRTLVSARCQNRRYLVLEGLVPSLNGDLPSGIDVRSIENHQSRIGG